MVALAECVSWYAKRVGRLRTRAERNGPMPGSAPARKPNNRESVMGEWQTVAKHPYSDAGEEPEVLVWSAKIGVPRVGRVITYPDGEKIGVASGYNGDWQVTHWQPLPEPPK